MNPPGWATHRMQLQKIGLGDRLFEGMALDEPNRGVGHGHAVTRLEIGNALSDLDDFTRPLMAEHVSRGRVLVGHIMEVQAADAARSGLDQDLAGTGLGPGRFPNRKLSRPLLEGDFRRSFPFSNTSGFFISAEIKSILRPCPFSSAGSAPCLSGDEAFARCRRASRKILDQFSCPVLRV